MLNNLKRRALTLLLSLAMIITYMPTSMIAYAVDGDDQAQVEKQVEAEAPAKEEATPKAEAAEEAAPKAEPAKEAAPEEVKPEESKSEEAAAPEEKSSEEAAKPADENPKADAEAEAEEDSKAEDKKPVEYTEELDTVAVKVTAPADAFSEEVKLVVKQLDKEKDKKEFKEAEDALAENKQTYAGILAFDIHFENSQGKEIEPDGAVSVEMTAKKAAFKGVDPGEVGNVQVTHISDEATVVADNADKAVDGTVDVQTTKKSVEKVDADFEVESFSTFTLTWGEGQKAYIHFGRASGGTFTEFDEEVINFDTNQSNFSLANNFDGVSYSGADYFATGEYSTSGGVSIHPTLYKTESGWQYVYTEEVAGEIVERRGDIANGSNIYVTYKDPVHYDPADSDDIPTPTTTKTVSDNHDGTMTVQIDIDGHTFEENDSHYANVLIVLDCTTSMRGEKWTAAKNAIDTLITTLTEGDNSGNHNKIDFALSTFGPTGTIIKGWDGVEGSVWSKDDDALQNYCSNTLAINSVQGTNWESGLYYGYQTLTQVPDNDPTYVIFVTDGDPYGHGRDNYNTQGTQNQHAEAAYDEAYDIAHYVRQLGAPTPKLYGIYTGANDAGGQASLTRLTNVISENGGVETILATPAQIVNKFKSIAETILKDLGVNDVSVDDGVTNLSDVSAQVPGKADAFEYQISEDGESWSDWAAAPGASYSKDNGVTWDLSEVGTVKEGAHYRLRFKVWPSQEAFDLIANLNNKTVDWEDVPLEEQAQINRVEESGGTYSYSLKTNTHLYTTYTYGDDTYTESPSVLPNGNMALVSDKINVFKHWEDDINDRNRADYVEFYLLIDGEYYQKDGTTATTTANAELLTTYAAGTVTLADGTKKTTSEADAWKASEYIAPGLATLSGTTVTALEDGHSFKVEEKAGYKWVDGKNTYQDYSMEFASQTVRPMVIYVNGVRTVYYFVEVDADHPAVGTTYTIVSTDGSRGTYYIDNVSATITAENKKTPELDITKIIDEDNSVTDLTPTQLDNEEFTYTVKFTFPKGSDPSGVGYWRYEPSDSGWTLGEYDSQTNYQPDNYTNGEKFYGESSTSIWGSGDSTDTSQGTLNKTVEVKLKRSEVLRFTNLPVDTEYTIVESAANGKTLASQGYTVSKINAGYTGTSGIVANSAATVTPASATVSGKTSAADTRYYHQFTNKLVAVDAELKVTKAMDYDWDKGDDNYEFTLTATGDAPLPYKNASDGNKVTVSSASELTKTFGLIRFIKAGTYTYTITETIPDPVNPAIVYGGPATVTVTVNADLEVTNITATGTEVTSKYTPAGNDKDAVGEVTITNKWAKTSLNGQKTWNDNDNEGGKRPSQIVVNLIEKGTTTVIESVTVTPDEDGNWVYSFNNLPKYKLVDGELVAIEYAVTEDPVTDYETVLVDPVKNADGTFTADIINTNVVLDTYTETFFKKTVTKANPKRAATFNFTLTEVANAAGDPKEGTTSVNGSVNFAANEATSKPVDFGKIVYSKADTYYYKIEETAPIPAGWSVTGSPAIVTVVVELNANNQLVVKSVTGGEIQNAYNASGTASIPVTKKLEVPGGFKGPETWSYDITVAAQNGAPSAETMTGTINQDTENGTINIGPITYTAPGTFTYNVTESGNVDGVENDKVTPKTVTVEVVDNGDGTLTATVKGADSTEDEPTDATTFTNTYKVTPITASFPVNKKLSVPQGLQGPEEWEYTIDVAAQDGAPVAASMSGKVNQDKDSITFGPITYTKPGTFTYNVTESGNVDGVENDKVTPKTVTVEVVDNGDGTLTATVKGADSTEAKPTDATTFTNTYSVEGEPVDATIIKKVESLQPGTESATFNFTIEAEDDAYPLPVKDGKENTAASITVTKTGNATVDFGKITFTAPGTYTYKITENVDELDGGWVVTGNPATFTVEVTDGGDGTLEAEVTKTDITNTYDTTSLNGKKVWNDSKYFDKDGNPIGDYERPTIKVHLYADGVELEDEVLTLTEETAEKDKDGNWIFSFTDLTKYKNHGVVEEGEESAEIEYTVQETDKDGNPISDAGFAVEISDDSTEIDNTPNEAEEVHDIDLTLKKVDAVTGNVIPNEAVFVLKKNGAEGDGTEYRTVNGVVTITFSEKGNNAGTYTLTETSAPTGYNIVKPDGYTIKVDKTFNTITFKESVWTWIYDLLFDDTTKAQFTSDEDGYTLTVPNPPETTSVTPKKVWNDNSDHDKIRPESVTFGLYKTVGTGEDATESKVLDKDGEPRTVTLTKPSGATVNTWTGVAIENLPKFEDGKPVTYSFKELNGTTPIEEGEALPSTKEGKNYTVHYDEDGVTVKNSYQSDPEKTVHYGEEETNIDGEMVKPGDILTYKIEYVNTTGVVAEAATITDKIPEFTTYVDGSATLEGEKAGTYDSSVKPAGELTWDLGDVPDGEKRTVTFQVEVDKHGASGEELKNQGIVHVGENHYDSNETSNPTPPDKDVVDADGVSIDGKTVKPDDTLTYVIKYTNPTDKEVTLTIKDDVPKYTEYLSGTAKPALDSSSTSKKLVWTGLKVAPGGSVEVKFDVKVLSETEDGEVVSGQAIINKASVNDYTTNEVTNYTPPKKTVHVASDENKINIDGKDVQPEQILTYSITYTNPDKENEAVVTFTDVIPDHTSYEEGSADPAAEYDSTNKKLTWSDIKIAAGKSATVTFNVKVDKAVDGDEIENEGTVKNGENDPMVTNKVINKTPTKVTIVKDLSNFVDHGKNEKATFAFSITGTSTSDEHEDYSNVIGMDFTGAETRYATVLIPSYIDLETVSVKEVISGDYTPDHPEASITKGEDGKWKVTFKNKYTDTGYKTGAINNYKYNNENGTYTTPEGPGDGQSQEGDGPGDGSGN